MSNIGCLFRHFHLLFSFSPELNCFLNSCFSRRDEPPSEPEAVYLETRCFPQITIIHPYFFFKIFPGCQKVYPQLRNQFFQIKMNTEISFGNSCQNHFERNNSIHKNKHLSNCDFIFKFSAYPIKQTKVSVPESVNQKTEFCIRIKSYSQTVTEGRCLMVIIYFGSLYKDEY